MITIIIPGDPVPLPRERVKVIRGKPHHYRTGPIVAYQETVRLLANQACQCPLLGPLIVQIDFTLERPATTKFAVPACKPDIDNLVKGVLDALNGIAYRDDKQVIELHARKLWGDISRTIVAIKKM